MEDAGACAIAVHGRYAEQLYRGRAEWGAIARVKEAVSVPVVGNGDVRSGADAVAVTERTGCDAVMIARAAEGNPWLFAQAKAALAGEPEPDGPTVEERIALARRHARLLSAREGRNIVRMRKHAMWYLAGLPGAAAARGLLSRSCSASRIPSPTRRARSCGGSRASASRAFLLLFRGARSRSEIVATFMAVLELCRASVIRLAGGETDCTVDCEQDAPETFTL